MRPFLTILFSKKIIKSLIYPFKGAVPLNGVIGYMLVEVDRSRQMQIDVGRCRKMQVKVGRCRQKQVDVGKSRQMLVEICRCRQKLVDTFTNSRHFQIQQTHVSAYRHIQTQQIHSDRAETCRKWDNLDKLDNEDNCCKWSDQGT